MKHDFMDIADYWDTMGFLTEDSDPKEAYLGYVWANVQPDEYPFTLRDFEQYIEHLKEKE